MVGTNPKDKIISANELMNAIRLWEYPLKQYYGNEVKVGMFTEHIQQLINEMPSIDIK